MGDASLHRCTIASANQSATTSAVVKAPLVRALLVKQRYTMYLALPFLYECVYNSVQMWYTIQHRTVLIILPLILQTIIIARIVSLGGREQESVWPHQGCVSYASCALGCSYQIYTHVG